MSTISASTTTTTAFRITTDTAGTLVFQTGSTPTTAMTLDASQNMGLGVTPLSWSAYKAIDLQGGSVASGSATSFELWANSFYNGTNSVYRVTGAASLYNQSGGLHRWYNAPSGTAGNAITFTQAMTLDASGNLGIGTSSPQYQLDLNKTGSTTLFGAGINADLDSADIALKLTSWGGSGGRSGSIRFITGAGVSAGTVAERARIDSSGNLLVGTTSTTQSHTFIGKVQNAWSFILSSPFSSQTFGMVVSYSAAAPNNTGNWFHYASDTVGQKFGVASNGGIYNFSANNSNLSDRREKTNFAPAGNYLAKICAIPVQTYNYIDQNLEEDDGLTLGVVAQDVQAVAPELVSESNWGTKENPKMRLGIYQTDMQYALMKCIQEQQAIIEQMQTRLTALEAK